jgi:hypothetical protein
LHDRIINRPLDVEANDDDDDPAVEFKSKSVPISITLINPFNRDL